MPDKELDAHRAEAERPNASKLSPSKKGHVPRQTLDDGIPYGWANDDLYNETLALEFRKDARVVSTLVGLSCALMVASWTFACTPDIPTLGLVWTEAGMLDTSRIPRLYAMLHYYAPMFAGMLACLPFMFAGLRSIHMHITYFLGEEPPSLALFDGNSPSDLSYRVRLWRGVALLIAGLLVLATALPMGPLWGSSWVWLAYVASCALLSAGAGFVGSHVALLFVTSRSRCIDDYDLLIPECGTDDECKRRIYYDHATGIARLLGSVFTLLSCAHLLAKVPGDLGSAQAYNATMNAYEMMPSISARIAWLIMALRGLAPAVLVLFALVLLAKALLRTWRFNTEWSILEIPAYSHVVDSARAGRLRTAGKLCSACVILRFGGIGLTTLLANGAPFGAQISDLLLVVVTLLTELPLEVLAGHAVTQVAGYLLTSEASYCDAHDHLSLFDDFSVVCTALDGLSLAHRAASALTIITMALSTTVVTLMVCGHPIASWGALAATILGRLSAL